MAEQQQPDTVPPPPGEEDLYSAETRVGRLPQDLLDSLRKFKSHGEAEEARRESARNDAAIDEIAHASDEHEREVDHETAIEHDAPPISVPARSLTSEALLVQAGVPDMEGSESESTEPTFDKPIRFIRRSLPSLSEADMKAEVRAGRRDVGALFLLAVIIAGVVAAYFAWKLH